MFDDPDQFLVGRPNVHLHFGFGRGIHHCVGAPLARLEARVALTRLRQRTELFTLDPGSPPRRAESIWVRGLDTLPAVVRTSTARARLSLTPRPHAEAEGEGHLQEGIT